MAHVKSMQINMLSPEFDILLKPNPQGDHAKPPENSEFKLVLNVLSYDTLLPHCDWMLKKDRSPIMQANMPESSAALCGPWIPHTILRFGKGIIAPFSHDPFSSLRALVGLRSEGSCAALPENVILNIFVSLSSSLSLSISLHVSQPTLPESLQLVGALENAGDGRPSQTASFSLPCFGRTGVDKLRHSKLRHDASSSSFLCGLSFDEALDSKRCNDASCRGSGETSLSALSICMTASAACMSEPLVPGSIPMRRPRQLLWR